MWSAGADVAELASQLRRPLFGWQAAVAAVGLERTARGRWHYPIVTACVPRQSGKTTLTAVVCIHRCLSLPEAQVWYTAQSRMDAVLRWREMVALLRRSPLVELVGSPRPTPSSGWDYRVRGATGNEVVEFSNGAQLRVFSPAEDSLHGSITDLVVLDEARFFDEARGRALMAAVLPTQATRDGQVWITSTAGGPDSVFLADELAASRVSMSSRGGRRCHAEWGVGPEVLDGAGLLEAVWAAHPSAGLPGGPRLDALAVAAGSMPSWQFAHEYGNRWQRLEDVRLLPAGAWSRAAGEGSLGSGRPVFGVDVAVDRSSAAVVACVAGRVELVECRPMADWVARRVLELVASWDAAAVVIDAGGPAGSVAEQLAPHLGDTLSVTSSRELAAACGGFYDALLADPPGVRYTRSSILDEAVEGAARRQLGQSWVFSRVASGPALLAMVLAWWVGQRVPVAAERSAIWV